MDIAQKRYPTQPDEDGCVYEQASDEALGIRTQTVGDDIFKHIALSGGRKAVMRELTGAETTTAGKIAGNNPDLLLPAYIALSTQIKDKDGKLVTFVAEDLAKWKGRDVNRLQVACQQINF
jgi:hypothetical protein